MTVVRGPVALVTGAASGIGAATAARLLADGASVVLADVDADAGERTTATLRQQGMAASFVGADVARAEDWRALREATVGRHGRLDIVVNNAFALTIGATHELTDAQWDRQLAVNLTAVRHSVRTFILDLSETGGCMVNVSSVHATFGFRHHAGYDATKGAILALTRALAVEYGPKVRVNAVVPGPIDTGVWTSDVARQRAARATVMQRMGDAADVAAAIAFLSSDDASYITGAALTVDGGWSIVKDSP